MTKVHRVGDLRVCGASTVAGGNTFITLEGQLIAVDGDGNSDGGGGLHTSHGWFTINGRGIIVAGDTADPDSLCPAPPHCEPDAVGFSSLMDVG